MGEKERQGLTHLDEDGAAQMVDVGPKAVTGREAHAEAVVSMRPETLAMILEGGIPKGDVFSTARIAGIMASKRTPDLVPLCHPLRIDSVSVEFEADTERSEVTVSSAVKATDRTGVEMEALTAAGVAAITIYDMCKAIDRAMEISRLRVTFKAGGKSGTVDFRDPAGE